MKKQQFVEILRAYIAKEAEYLKEHEQVKAILTPLQGQPINGRTLSEKRLSVFEQDGQKFKFSIKVGMYYITGKFKHLIGYMGSENTIQVEATDTHRGFEYLDGCHGHAARTRIQQVEAVLNNPEKLQTAYKAFKRVNDAYNELKAAIKDIEGQNLDSYHFPAHYDVMRVIQPGEEGRKVDISYLKYL